MSLQRCKPRLNQVPRKFVHGPEVRGHHGMVETFMCRALKESQQKVSARTQAPGEFRQDRRPLGRVQVDEGIPGENAAQRAVFRFEVPERTDTKPDAGKQACGQLNKLRDQIDSLDADSLFA